MMGSLLHNQSIAKTKGEEGELMVSGSSMPVELLNRLVRLNKGTHLIGWNSTELIKYGLNITLGWIWMIRHL